jgi:hypothetical protein
MINPTPNEEITAPITDSYKSFGSGLYAKVFPPLYRTIGREPDIQEDGSHININETIDASVFKRWRADPTYRPASANTSLPMKSVHGGKADSATARTYFRK